MSFDSLAYLLFLPAVTVLHWLCPSRWRWAVLLAASCLFYMSWSVPLALLLLAQVGVSWLAGLALARTRRPGLRRLILALALGICLGLLGYFKYFHFLARSLSALLGGRWGWPVWGCLPGTVSGWRCSWRCVPPWTAWAGRGSRFRTWPMYISS